MKLLRDAFAPEQFRESAHQVVDFLADMLGQSLEGIHEQVLPWADPESAFKEIQQWPRNHAPLAIVRRRKMRTRSVKRRGNQTP